MISTELWAKASSLRERVAVLVGTALGAGFFPKSPGTAGSLVALPLIYLTLAWPPEARFLFWLALAIAGTWAAKTIDELTGLGDTQLIVIDEVLGMAITAWFLVPDWTSHWPSWLVAFILFRFFDITKIPPVRQLDRWSKKMALRKNGWASWWGGFGVLADDLLAGLQGLAVFLLLRHWNFLT